MVSYLEKTIYYFVVIIHMDYQFWVTFVRARLLFNSYLGCTLLKYHLAIIIVFFSTSILLKPIEEFRGITSPRSISEYSIYIYIYICGPWDGNFCFTFIVQILYVSEPRTWSSLCLKGTCHLTMQHHQKVECVIKSYAFLGYQRQVTAFVDQMTTYKMAGMGTTSITWY